MNKVKLCDDQKYRWVYELNLFKNPTIFFLIWKIFFFIILGIFPFMEILAIEDGINVILSNLKILLYFIIGMTILVGIGYLIYALTMSGKYIVEFEMDEKGIKHQQSASQAKKANAIGVATAIAGASANNPTSVGIGINSQRTEMYTEFLKVKKIKIYPKRNLIKLNESLNNNQIYVIKEDFDFVKEYIISHCSNVKKKGK